MNSAQPVPLHLSKLWQAPYHHHDYALTNDKQSVVLCIVETPSDIHAIEQSSAYKGKYFVLSGYLSPIDGIGAAELGLDALEQKLHKQGIEEIILATNATIEGEVTAHYISNMAKQFDIRITRIAHGLPIGGELEYADINTIAHALSGRKDYNY
jgi:recombination protein RecR